MEYKFQENELRMACCRLRNIELELSLLKEMIEKFKFEILGFAKDQEEKENGKV